MRHGSGARKPAQVAIEAEGGSCLDYVEFARRRVDLCVEERRASFARARLFPKNEVSAEESRLAVWTREEAPGSIPEVSRGVGCFWKQRERIRPAVVMEP